MEAEIQPSNLAAQRIVLLAEIYSWLLSRRTNRLASSKLREEGNTTKIKRNHTKTHLNFEYPTNPIDLLEKDITR